MDRGSVPSHFARNCCLKISTFIFRECHIFLFCPEYLMYGFDIYHIEKYKQYNLKIFSKSLYSCRFVPEPVETMRIMRLDCIRQKAHTNQHVSNVDIND